MALKGWIRDTLERSGIPYSVLHHDRVFTAQGLAHREHFSGRHVAKTVVLMANGYPVQAVLPASRHMDLAKFAAVLGVADLHLATEGEMRGLFPDCAVGAEPPLRHWKNVELWMDESLRTNGDILFAGGTHEDGIRMNFADWYRVARPNVAAFSTTCGG